jgi:RNA methyltransferase, TrmH family
MKTITSLQNPDIKKIAQLGDAKERKTQKRFIVEGLRALETFLNANWKPQALYATPDMHEDAQELFDTEITVVSDAVMKKISQATTPSGILGVFAIPAQPPAKELRSGIVLAQLADPGNVGTLIRTCAALGQKTVICIDSVDVWSPKVVQSSGGTLALMNVFHYSWDELVQQRITQNIIGLVARGGKVPSQKLFKDALIVVGSEARGLPTHWQEECDELVTLPMPGNVESLNAAIAGSIAMYLAWAPHA